MDSNSRDLLKAGAATGFVIGILAALAVLKPAPAPLPPDVTIEDLTPNGELTAIYKDPITLKGNGDLAFPFNRNGALCDLAVSAQSATVEFNCTGIRSQSPIAALDPVKDSQLRQVIRLASLMGCIEHGETPGYKNVCALFRAGIN